MNDQPRQLRPTKVMTATHVSVVIVIVAGVAALGLGAIAFLTWIQR